MWIRRMLAVQRPGATVAHTFVIKPEARIREETQLVLAARRYDETMIISGPRQGAYPRSSDNPASRAGVAETVAVVGPTLIAKTHVAPTMPSEAPSDVPPTIPSEAPSGFTERSCLPQGHVVYKYKISVPLGSGGFAITYCAQDQSINRSVALKELFPIGVCYRTGDSELSSDGSERGDSLFNWAKFFFSEEARVTFSLRHENIVRIYDFFKLNNTAYIAYEMLNGLELGPWRERNHSNINDNYLVELFRVLCKGLDHVHKRGFIHRDIKPPNILISEELNEPILIDFGAATQLGGDSGEFPAVMTPGFSPIEQYPVADYTSRQDERSDIYALCATMYWAISGRTPIAADQRRLGDPLPPLRSIIDPPHRFSERLCRVIETGLHVEAKDRYANIKELLADLSPKIATPSTGYAGEPRGDKIFLSYRRDDSAHFVGRLLDFLELRFGSGSVFLDVGSVPIGVDFWDHIRSFLDDCAVMLVVIGPRWMRLYQQKSRKWYRKSREYDYVSMEINSALEMRLPIIPVLFDSANLPIARSLPVSIRQLTSLNAAIIGQGAAFRAGAESIADQIARLRTSSTSQ